MTAMENPLIIYRTWFAGLNPGWAERIASFMFNTIRHYKPLKNTCFASASTIHSFHRHSKGYTNWLLELIRSHISSNDPYNNQQLAVLLHCGTQMVLDADKQSRHQDREQYKESYIKTLLIGDLRSAAYFEQKVLYQDHSKQQLYATWNKIISSGFSFASIHSFLLKRMTGNYRS